MLDFMVVSTRSTKRGTIEIYPKFLIKKSTDLMIRGGDFYAIWIEERGLWSTDEQDALQLIDRELDRYAEENRQRFNSDIKVLHMWDAESGMIDSWHKYCQKQLRDSFHTLDDKLIFSNTETTKKDYASKRLNYPLEEGDITAYEKLISTLYSPEERMKIEWAIGSIVCGESQKLQKFLVLYGAAGTGKSTILNIIQQLFEGYYSVFDAKALGSSSNSFALEAFKSNPLVAIQHDGDLSRIEDNTRLNSLVSHELMTVNEKFKSTYANRFKCFLFMGTNKPVRITDAKSGLIRRLIDVSPSGNKLNPKEYKTIVKQVSFELGAIAYHCREIYLDNPGRYDDYIPISMLGASNDFYNFIADSYYVFKKEDGTTLKAAWEMYKNYCEEAKVGYPLSRRAFQEELKNYFKDFQERFNFDDGSRVRSYYIGFRTDKFESDTQTKKKETPKTYQIEFKEQESVFDSVCADCPAQYASQNETPQQKWEKVKTKLSALDTSQIHYVKVPENHIVVDFDIPDETGNKSFEKNLEAASKLPPTYAELSKSGQGIHLHYLYSGDPSKLSRIYDDHIEIKVFTGKSSLRRKLTKCNNLPIATISSGLPMKGEDKMVNFDAIKSEKGLRTLIKRNLNKEIHPGTKPSIDFIYKILEDAHSSELKYDVTDMRNAVLAFAANSSHQAEYCIKLVNKMQFRSEENSNAVKNDDAKLVFYDIEVFPNLFLVNWKIEGEGKPVVRMINPTPTEIEELIQLRLVGFNCRRYDNHIMYARLMGYTNEQLYNLSQKIINNSPNCFFGEAYNISFTDVYDFCSKKQSLKKWEIELSNKANDPYSKMDDEVRALCKKIKHHELGLPWDQPVPEELWTKVAEYCDDDVIATEATFKANLGDFVAREILAELANGSVNDTTNSLTTKFIFGKNRNPQSEFMYRDLSEPVTELPDDVLEFLKEAKPEMMAEPFHGPKGDSLLPYFPDYRFENGKSLYRGEEVGEGGEVWAAPGMYGRSETEDVGSMHPNSAISECLLGPDFTKRFKDILDIRIHIKHGDFDMVRAMFEGALAKYLDDTGKAKALAQALKIAINSVYGLTAAGFMNAFRDSRNKDNIVAKRGALFMIDLRHEVEAQGYKVIHIKTDSIKIENPDDYILDFICKYGKRHGYDFEVEHIFDRICLVNNAVYVAKLADDDPENPGTWTATGTQFQIPYVFKNLFSKENIKFEDMCETKSVSGSLYLDLNEGLPDVSQYEKEFSKAESDFKKGLLSDTTFESTCQRLNPLIAKGHNYRFIGKVGQFCPIKDGCGGGLLMREKDNKYYAATGTKGYRWLESEMVRELDKVDDIDRSYYDKLVNEAVDTISQYGDFEMFVSDDPFITEKKQNTPKLMPCGDAKYATCFDCPHFNDDAYHMDCGKNYDISEVISSQVMNPPVETK